MARIWFNRGYSLAPIAASIMATEPAIQVYASVGKGMPRRPGPVETWIEPEEVGKAYLDWLSSTITTHRIDVLVPTWHRGLIASARLPCRIALPAASGGLDLLEDKFAFAQATAQTNCHLPTQLVTDSAGLRRALVSFAETAGPGAIPCVKPRRGVNGIGFWKLTGTNPASHIENPDARTIRSDMFLAALRQREVEHPIQELVLMEYLPGPEVSFDILCHVGRVLKYAARTKHPDSSQSVRTEHELGPCVTDLVEQFQLSGVINIQFRRASDGGWRVLEINTRPAGGSVYAESVGCAILSDWARLLVGMITPDQVHTQSVDARIALTTSVTHIAA